MQTRLGDWVCKHSHGCKPGAHLLVVSFVKPMAFSRYFVVLVPAVLPVRGVQVGALISIALAAPPLPLELWLASSGSSQAMECKLKPLQSQVVEAGYHCEQRANDLTHARLLRCRSDHGPFRVS